ncbi:YbhB/YbcL family Raf kinase inhibitor-like protein [Zoogloea sp.]|uniref:YbhB/YbcL family Raf kinase inhibitor-like protein n=1 Tax=Zoogloea sp. TaxID=49181 RepID=UPI0035B195B6
MKIHSDSFADGSVIPGQFAFCVPAAEGHVSLSSNRNPHLAWNDTPTGTRSFVLICHDPDVPSRGDDVNQEGRSVPADLPRVDFFHWALIDLPASVTSIAEGAHSSAVTANGKPGPDLPDGSRHGLNDYTGWFAGDEQMKGNYFGYDGPCPPWNDSIRHRYVFTVYALDIPRLPLEGIFTGQQVRDAMTGHILAQASLTGTYSLNPAVPA